MGGGTPAGDGAAPRDRRAAWQAVGERVGGSFSEAKVTGGYTVTATHGPWTLTLDLRMISSGFVNLMHTRLLALFMSRDDLRLTVRRRTVFDGLAKRLGLGGASFAGGDPAGRFMVKGRPGARVRSILGAGLVEVLAASRISRLEVGPASRAQRRKMASGVRRLQVLSPGVDTDVARMVDMFEVARRTLDVLARVGTASSDPPGRTPSPD